ncbi:MAG TPA: 5-(carboxyamino)imidazole ribonucleotide synthase [Methylovirgula sp.]|nr:5-(carboxyamino)imidazole ribonucleotide synthase [Methylovirgula sp.]
MALRPGNTIGILGGGQLGRMLAMAAAELGLKVHVYAPQGDNPAFEVAAHHTVGSFEDADKLAEFGAAVDVATYEFENIPASSVAALACVCPVRPALPALAASQDRLAEKEFLGSLGIETATYVPVEDAGALARAVGKLGRPTILKTRRLGYDGKGQITVREGSDLAASFRSLGGVPAILESVVPFVKEVSVIAARGLDGSFAAYDVTENMHVNHILSTSRAPAEIESSTAERAITAARRIAEALDYVGVLAVEYFLVEEPGPDGRLDQKIKVNEIAPRVHNSGHWTLDGALCSQFEQHIRAIAGWPLGSTERRGTVVMMQNLLGDEAENFAGILAEPGAHLHLYGKAQARPGRKMGHVTRITRKA